MVAYAFNATQYTPQYGGGNTSLPAGKYKGVIVDSSLDNVEKNGVVTGGYLALILKPIEGPLAGQIHTDRLNLNNTNSTVVEIANKQLSAYCSVIGVPAFQDTAELYNKPFFFEIAVQKNKDGTPHEKGYTEVVALADLNGNPPGKAGSGAPAVAPAPVHVPEAPPAGVTATTAPAAWGAPAPTPAPAAATTVDSGVPTPAAWGAPAPTPAPAAAPAAWGAPPAGGAAAPPAGWGPPAA